ncbi:MAG: DUF4924 family protein [Bacteroidales bacterium]|jgi:hypothetical protein|nr:DUF4924 family protein [Bacteroidales bacterium]
MIIAEQKKQDNIIEYIIYMFQIQDILRANNFEIEKINDLIINKYNISETEKKIVRNWYENLINLMYEDKITVSGNLKFLNNLMTELNNLHKVLLSDEHNLKHAELYRWAKPNINEFKELSKSNSENEIEICINALYSLFLLRLQKKAISDNTMMAMQTFSNLLANIALVYKCLALK